MLPELRALPVRVRPIPSETITSYERRVAKANGMTPGLWKYWLKPYRSEKGSGETEARVAALECVAGLEPGHFARERRRLPSHPDRTACLHCVTHLSGRFGCTRCSGGERAEQEPHDGPRACRRHRRWVGPGVAPEEQFQVGHEVLEADRRYSKLKKRGVMDAHRLAELLDLVDMWLKGEDMREMNAAERFTVAIDLADHVFRPSRFRFVADSRHAASGRYRALSTLVHDVTGRPSAVLTDGIWCLIRTVVAKDARDPHRLIPGVNGGLRSDSGDLDELRTSSFPRRLHLHLTQFVDSDREGTRFDRARAVKVQNHYVCPRGHHWTATFAPFGSAGATGGCPYCAKRRPLAGFNTLDDLHPALAAEWHPTANGDLRPHHVVEGSTRIVTWLCPAGHTWSSSVIVRSHRGTRCGFCRNHRVDATNSLRTTHTALAEEWHPTRNGSDNPDTVYAGSERSAWWVCPRGHEYRKSLVLRARGGGCGVCARHYASPSTSLAVTHPAVAKRWDRRRNGTLTPRDVLSGSGKKVWFKCKRGHSYQSSVRNAALGTGCSVCWKKVVSAENCMRTTHPALAAEFHPSKNGADTPDTVIATSYRRFWWKCERGHEWQVAGSNRANGTGCPFCHNRRVLVGWNDMATTHPRLAAEWDGTANGDLAPTQVVAGTSRLLAWVCAVGHSYQARGSHRARGGGCPFCAKTRNGG